MQGACQRLVAAANDDGGSDNITVVVARFHDVQDALPLECVQAEVDEFGRSEPPLSANDALANGQQDFSVAVDQ